MIRIARTVVSEPVATGLESNFEQLDAILRNHSTAELINFFAQPRVTSDNTVEWYSQLNGRPVSLDSLSGMALQQAESRLQEKLSALQQLLIKLTEKDVLTADQKYLLEIASQRPDRESVWVIEGQPVITSWPSRHRTITPVSCTRKIWPWWLAALILLLMLTVFLLRNCNGNVPTKPANIVQEKAPEPVAQKQCLAKPDTKQPPEVVIIFDASGSMTISMDATQQELERWNAGLTVDNIEREPRRISLARTSAKEIIDQLPVDMNVSMVAAADCKRVTTTSPFSTAQRGILKHAIDKIEPDGKTALAEALIKAGNMVDGVNRDAIILLITDGDETCGGDPCETASRLKKQKPRLTVNVVDIMSTGAGNCIASNTGGQVYPVNNTGEFRKMMQIAAQESISKSCD